MIVRAAQRIRRKAATWALQRAARRLPSPPFEPDRVRKIGVPLYAGIGNIVLYGPALRAIRDRFADAELVAIVGNGRRNEEVLEPGLVDRVLECPLGPSAEHRRDDARRVREERFDLCVNAFHFAQPEHAALTVAAAIPWRCGHVTSPGWSSPYDVVYNLPAVMQRDQYEVDRYLELAYALGIARGTVDETPRFHVTDAARERAIVALAERGVAPGTPILVVHAGTSEIMRWKQWGLDRFEAVVRRLVDETTATFVLVGASDEHAEQLPMIARLSETAPGRFVDLVGATDVPALGAVLERSLGLVGNDSGPMQIAVALGVPTVIPWGPSDHPRNAPRGPEHTILFKRLPCSPCYRMPGDSAVHLCGDRQCLKQIAVDEVARAASERLLATVSRS